MFKHRGGYSLLELVIYIGLFALLSIVIMKSLVVVMKTYTTAQAYRRLQANGSLVMERITREMRDASVISGSSVFGSHPGTLSLSGSDGSETEHTVSFSVASNGVRVTENGVTGTLTTNEVIVNNLVFRKITTTVGEGVKIELTLTTANGHIVTAKFYDTVLLRGN